MKEKFTFDKLLCLMLKSKSKWQILLEQSGKRLLEHRCGNPYNKGTPWRRVRRDWRRKLDFEVDANLGKWGKNNFTQRNNEKSCKRQAFVWSQRNFFHFLTDKGDLTIYLHSFHEHPSFMLLPKKMIFTEVLVELFKKSVPVGQ